MANPQDRQWTMAVDLAVNLDMPGEHGLLGAEDKMGKLRQLQAQTAGKPVTIVAQQIVRENRNGKTVFALKRYAIHDGQIDDLTPSAVASKGTAQDLTDLLKIAGQQYPSARLGLVTNSHGNGDDGIMGDNGAVSLARLQAAIKEGLNGSGHAKLDLVNFDACLMAQVGVLDRMAAVAKHLIASASPEFASPDSNKLDGQNLNAWMSDLLNNPYMDGGQLAHDIIRQADQGANDDGYTSGTVTLAHFNLERSYARFEKGFDQFSIALAQAAGDPRNREEIRTAMGKASPYNSNKPLSVALDGLTPESYRWQLGDEKRDLVSFASSISKLIADGKIADPDGSLGRSSTEVQASLTAMTTFHGPQKFHGLAAFLPAKQYLDTQEATIRTTTIGQILDFTNPKMPIGIREINIPPLDEAFRRVEQQMKNDPEAQDALRSGRTSMQEIRRLNADGLPNSKALEQAEQSLRNSAQRLEGTVIFQLERGVRAGQINDAFRHERDVQSETPSRSWSKFIDSVKN
jgi:Clostripain family